MNFSLNVVKRSNITPLVFWKIKFYARQSRTFLDFGTCSQLHEAKRWECQITLFKWHFWTRNYLNKNLQNWCAHWLTSFFWNKPFWTFAQCLYCPSTTLQYSKRHKSKFATVKIFVCHFLRNPKFEMNVSR